MTIRVDGTTIKIHCRISFSSLRAQLSCPTLDIERDLVCAEMPRLIRHVDRFFVDIMEHQRATGAIRVIAANLRQVFGCMTDTSVWNDEVVE